MTASDPLATLPPILARKLANLPPQQLHQILQTKEGPNDATANTQPGATHEPTT